MPSQLLVVHERVGNWARQLRPRLAGRPVRLVETRSADDLEAALAGAACPILLVDLARRPRAALEDLDRGLRVSPGALALVLDPEGHEGAALLAREVGASHVAAGPVTPPAVVDLLSRWLPLAQRRSESAGWSAATPEPPEPEPWNWLTPMLNGLACEPRASRN